MTDEDRHEVEMIFKRLIVEHEERLKESKDIAYSKVSRILFDYYKHGEKRRDVKEALITLQDDDYIGIIEAYYKNNKTVEVIAEEYFVDISTITRNKKRICVKIYNLLI